MSIATKSLYLCCRPKKPPLRNRTDTNLNIEEHILPLELLVRRLNTNVDEGLSEYQVYEILKRDGANTLTPQPLNKKLFLFLKNLFGGFGILLLIGASLCFVAYGINFLNHHVNSAESLLLGIALVFVNILSGSFSFYQDEKCKTVINSFNKIAPQRATVIRDNVIKIIKVENLVVGDIVQLKAGEKVPADIRIIKSQQLKVDNSSLTGEPEPQERSSEMTNLDPFKTNNLVFFGTLVVEGSGMGIVINTGDRTVMGTTAYITSEIEFWKTPMSREISYFVNGITVAAVSIGFTFFIVSLIYGNSWIDSVIFLISILVAKLPEGLSATIAVALTLVAKKISKKNCLVKNLEAVVTLGCTTTICSDKTGTLTQNRMTISNIWFNNRIHRADSIINGECLTQPETVSWEKLTRCARLCNNATFESTKLDLPVNERSCKGNPTEIAILKFLEDSVHNVQKYRDKCPKIIEYPFASSYKFQATIHQTDQVDNDKRYLLVMQGAPEKIIQNCSEILIDCQNLPLDSKWRSKINQALRIMAESGERVLGFCDMRLKAKEFPRGFEFKIQENGETNFPLKNMRFLGLITMIDPPRASVYDAVQKCKTAGIRLIMITGDHPITAKAIAKSVGIITHDKVVQLGETSRRRSSVIPLNTSNTKAAVVDGEYLKNLAQYELDELLRRYPEIVFSRTTPYQKLTIVESCQRLGEIVAVTGDGVNDSPALKRADIGIAMGISGSEVSKEVADMVILDDNFSSIEVAIEEGRLVFENIRKSIAYILTSKIPELTPFILHILANIPLPLGAITILCIDLGTDLFPAIALAYERAEFDLMKNPPRNSRKDRLVDMKLVTLSYFQYGMITASAGYFTYHIIMAQNGFLPSRLMGMRRSWDSIYVNDLEDSYGQEWTFEQRKALEYTCHSGFFISVVVVQLANLIICKTRKMSFFKQKMKNQVLNISIIFVLILANILCYTPKLDEAIHLYPLKGTWWFPSIIFAIFLIIYDEIRKFLIRKFPDGLLANEMHT